jgi:lactate permease
VVRRKPVFDERVLDTNDLAIKGQQRLIVAASPWILLLCFAALVNLKVLPFFDLFFTKNPLALTIIPGKPIATRVLWQAYTWVAVSTLLAAFFLKPSAAQWRTVFQKTCKRAPRPVWAAGIYFAIAYLIDHSGKGPDWVMAEGGRNMVHVMAAAAAAGFGSLYGLVAPYLGLLAGFVAGSETSAIAMLSRFHIETATALGKPFHVGLLLAAASGIGGGLASVISPAKLQNAAAIIDRIGEEGKVLRTTVVISLVITLLAAVATLIWCGMG